MADLRLFDILEVTHVAPDGEESPAKIHYVMPSALISLRVIDAMRQFHNENPDVDLGEGADTADIIAFLGYQEKAQASVVGLITEVDGLTINGKKWSELPLEHKILATAVYSGTLFTPMLNVIIGSSSEEDSE